MNSTISRYQTMLLEDKCLIIKGIVMDMDGTITKFNLDYMAARRKALGELDKLNLRTPEMSEQLSLYLILKKLKDELDTDKFTILRRRFYDLLEDMEVKAAKEVTLYPGALETLRMLRARHEDWISNEQRACRHGDNSQAIPTGKLLRRNRYER